MWQRATASAAAARGEAECRPDSRAGVGSSGVRHSAEDALDAGENALRALPPEKRFASRLGG
eukprot:5456822-Pleurochrysis_carterae.AAC.1